MIVMVLSVSIISPTVVLAVVGALILGLTIPFLLRPAD